MSNTVSLDAAHKTATERKKAKEWREDGLRTLRKRRPDLADRYRQRELNYEEAETLFAEREREAGSATASTRPSSRRSGRSMPLTAPARCWPASSAAATRRKSAWPS